jgi:hypothetical protein
MRRRQTPTEARDLNRLSSTNTLDLRGQDSFEKQSDHMPANQYRPYGSYRKPYRSDPFRCSYCNSNRTLRAFATIYAQGSSLSKYRKGLIIKTGWAETRKQSVLAMQCEPPRKRSLWWRVLLLVAGIAGNMLLPTIQFLDAYAATMDVISDLTILLGAFLVVDAFRWNRFSYSGRMDTWENSFFCVRCSRVTILTPAS